MHDRTIDQLVREASEQGLSRRQLIQRAAALGISAAALSPVMTRMAPAAHAQDRPTLRLGQNAADIASLDPHYAAGTQDRALVDMVFNGLIRFKPGDSTQWEPDLATEVPEPTMDGGKQVWTFTLRDGVQVHKTAQSDAYPLTADDVVFSYKKAADANTSAYSGDYQGVAVAKVDAKTVTFTLDSPLSPTLFLPKVANYSGGYVAPQKAYEALGADAFKTAPAGTGPFKFDSYTPQNSVTLVANDDYFRGAPKLAGVDYRFIEEASSRESALLAGDLDVINGLPEGQWVDKINKIDNFEADVFGVGEAVFLCLNVAAKPFDDAKVRQAIALALSRDAHVALFGAPVGEPIYSVVPAQLMPGGLTEDEAKEAGVLYQQNVDQAKQLLAEAGSPSGFDVKLVTSQMDDYRRNYEAMQEELNAIGVKIDLQVVQHAAMHELIRKGTNPLVIYVAFRPTADTYLTQFFTTAGGNTNFSHYTAVDDLVAKARTTTNADEQAKMWRDANIQILKDYAAYPFLIKNLVYARSKNVDYGHELKSVVQLYPGIDETTTITS
ncbi:MAG TPA: ABC transporter substrate-binding protein [Thermomicrobiales bacterium]|nr:ABC transporter substrate-binding protein [Thermomicrobiales bacterium]